MKKLFAAILAIALVLSSVAALADWPERTIELVVPANPGGDSDSNARALAAALKEEMGWDVVVSNMAGGSGAVAMNDVLGNTGDGYRFVFYHSGSCIAEIMGIFTDFNMIDSFKLCGLPFVDYSNSFLINGKNPNFHDLPSMVEYMKANPGKVTFATEIGAFTHLHVLMFEEAAGVEFSIVNAGTASQKITELLGERLDVIGTQAGLVRDYLTTGDMICVGILAPEKIEGHDELLTMKEQGYDVVVSKFFYVAAPNAVSDEIVAAMNAGLAKAVENETLKAYAAKALLNLDNKTPEETEAFYAEQSAIYESYLQ